MGSHDLLLGTRPIIGYMIDYRIHDLFDMRLIASIIFDMRLIASIMFDMRLIASIIFETDSFHNIWHGPDSFPNIIGYMIDYWIHDQISDTWSNLRRMIDYRSRLSDTRSIIGYMIDCRYDSVYRITGESVWIDVHRFRSIPCVRDITNDAHQPRHILAQSVSQCDQRCDSDMCSYDDTLQSSMVAAGGGARRAQRSRRFERTWIIDESMNVRELIRHAQARQAQS